jgi:hypothetical protein
MIPWFFSTCQQGGAVAQRAANRASEESRRLNCLYFERWIWSIS